MGNSDRVRLDLNAPPFLKKFLALSPADLATAVKALRKLSAMTWAEVYADHGLKWELIETVRGQGGEKVYSFRITRSFRALARREGDWLRLMALFPEHDAAYGRK
mgnify:FL=1